MGTGVSFQYKQQNSKYYLTYCDKCDSCCIIYKYNMSCHNGNHKVSFCKEINILTSKFLLKEDILSMITLYKKQKKIVTPHINTPQETTIETTIHSVL